jgi:predicted metal-dependent phosphotriesterase family hydrolase
MELMAGKFHVAWQRRNQATRLHLVRACARTHARTRARTHTHTHTHTQAPLLRTHTVIEDEGEQRWGEVGWGAMTCYHQAGLC